MEQMTHVITSLKPWSISQGLLGGWREYIPIFPAKELCCFPGALFPPCSFTKQSFTKPLIKGKSEGPDNPM